jgi:hypothetical protein
MSWRGHFSRICARVMCAVQALGAGHPQRFYRQPVFFAFVIRAKVEVSRARHLNHVNERRW